MKLEVKKRFNLRETENKKCSKDLKNLGSDLVFAKFLTFERQKNISCMKQNM